MVLGSRRPVHQETAVLRRHQPEHQYLQQVPGWMPVARLWVMRGPGGTPAADDVRSSSVHRHFSRRPGTHCEPHHDRRCGAWRFPDGRPVRRIGLPARLCSCRFRRIRRYSPLESEFLCRWQQRDCCCRIVRRQTRLPRRPVPDGHPSGSMRRPFLRRRQLWPLHWRRHRERRLYGIREAAGGPGQPRTLQLTRPLRKFPRQTFRRPADAGYRDE